MKNKKLVAAGKKGMDHRWSNYTKYLIEELSKLSSKQEMNFFQAFSTSKNYRQFLREALDRKLHEKTTK